MIDVLFISVKQPFYFYYNYYFFIFVIFFKISYCQSLAADHPEYLTEAMCIQGCTMYMACFYQIMLTGMQNLSITKPVIIKHVSIC